MFNLFENKSDTHSFIGLVRNDAKADTKLSEINSRHIVSGFAVLSLLVLSVIANGTQYQQSVELQKFATMASYSSAV